MFSQLLNMKLKNFVFILLMFVFGFFILIYYMTQSTVQQTRLLVKYHRHLGFAIDDVYIEDVIDSSKIKENLFFDTYQFEKMLNKSKRTPVHVYQRSSFASDLLNMIPAEASIFVTDRMPTDHKQYPYIGNGHIATVVDSDTVYMNGLYNGYMNDSHRARIPSRIAVRLKPLGPYTSVKTFYSFDVGQGVFNETISGSYFVIEKLTYAHRDIKELIVTEIKIQRWEIATELTVVFDVNHGPSSDDIIFKESSNLIAESTKMDGITKEAESKSSKPLPVHVIYTNVPPNVTFSQSMTMWAGTYLMSISHSPVIATKSFELGLHYTKLNSLMYMHTYAWSNLWKDGRIDIEGDLPNAQITYIALHNILSSLPSNTDSDWPFAGISPCGLSNGGNNQDYWGHVLWDQETWMYPGIALLYQNASKVMLSSRLSRLSAAKQNAVSTGYSGAQYPWESAHTGLEVSVSANTAHYEQHISGDIALAIQQQFYLSHNITYLNESLPVIRGIADFWVSRVALNKQTHKYHVFGVMPPDEYHYPVNDSVYTNAVALKSIMFAIYSLELLKLQVPEIYKTVVNNMYIPYDELKQYHPEFDGYKSGTEIKQADAILLGWPVQFSMSRKNRMNDLLIYEKVIDKNGPAMTWQAFAIGWFELKEIKKAEPSSTNGKTMLMVHLRSGLKKKEDTVVCLFSLVSADTYNPFYMDILEFVLNTVNLRLTQLYHRMQHVFDSLALIT